jgi:Flp pilus assembly protein TadG
MKHERVWRRVWRFRRDERGGVLIYVTLLMPVLVGFALLAVDVARLQNLQTSLQKGADALALAGAAELDRKPTAITRADAAIANLVANKHKFSTIGLATVAVASKRYLSSLPASDASAVGSAFATTDPALARFVEVTVTTQTLNTIFPASLLGGTNSASTNARAIAGFDAAVCQFTPMFICNPWEGTGTSLFEAIADPALRRRQIKLQSGGGGTAQYFPGNYGWLDSPTLGSGADALRDALAMVRPPACFIQNGVSQHTGNISNADDAINVRFDLWAGPFNNQNKNSLYRPSQNVRKGYVPGSGTKGACNPTASSPNTNKLGRDSAFPYAGGRMGNGTWDFNTYWASNFGGTAPNGWSNANLPSRYEVHRYEIDNNLTATAATGGNAPGEKGTPACYSGGGLSDNPDRRVLYAAIIDCSALNVHGNSGGPLAATAFGKFFITEPVTGGDIYSEMFGLVEPGAVSSDVARDIVQLYR